MTHHPLNLTEIAGHIIGDRPQPPSTVNRNDIWLPPQAQVLHLQDSPSLICATIDVRDYGGVFGHVYCAAGLIAWSTPVIEHSLGVEVHAPGIKGKIPMLFVDWWRLDQPADAWQHFNEARAMLERVTMNFEDFARTMDPAPSGVLTEERARFGWLNRPGGPIDA